MPQTRRVTGDLRHLVTCEGKTTTSDGNGGYIETWAPLVPSPVWAAIEPARRRDVEGVTGSVTIQAVATHMVTMDYHAQITVESRLWYHSRELQIHALANPNEANNQLVLVCTEVLHGGAS
jgi:SPP1 family predicted phage head-tail adaptor